MSNIISVYEKISSASSLCLRDGNCVSYIVDPCTKGNIQLYFGMHYIRRWTEWDIECHIHCRNDRDFDYPSKMRSHFINCFICEDGIVYAKKK